LKMRLASLRSAQLLIKRRDGLYEERLNGTTKEGDVAGVLATMKKIEEAQGKIVESIKKKLKAYKLEDEEGESFLLHGVGYGAVLIEREKYVENQEANISQARETRRQLKISSKSALGGREGERRKSELMAGLDAKKKKAMLALRTKGALTKKISTPSKSPSQASPAVARGRTLSPTRTGTGTAPVRKSLSPGPVKTPVKTPVKRLATPVRKTTTTTKTTPTKTPVKRLGASSPVRKTTQITTKMATTTATKTKSSPVRKTLVERAALAAAASASPIRKVSPGPPKMPRPSKLGLRK